MKYNNSKITHDGYSFASKLEAAVYELCKNELLQIQATILLTKASIKYIVDFRCKDQNGNEYFVEAKGFETDVWRIKRRLWKYYGPGHLLIYKGNYKNPKLDEVIIPQES